MFQVTNKVFLTAAIAAASLSLAACGGGGGGGGSVTPPTPVVTQTPSSNCPAGMSCPTGMLMSDPTNTPMAGIKVALEPWTAGAGPIAAYNTTTASDGSFSWPAGVTPGHYLLVVGSDSTSDLTHPTIHDNVTLTAGAQTLTAPTLPAITGFTPPAVETSGHYRLVTLDATNEVPCIQGFNTQRVNYTPSLPQLVADEWLVESTRNVVAAAVAANHLTTVAITTGNVATNGGSNCSALYGGTTFNGSNTYAVSANTLWVGANYQAGAQPWGFAEFPIDPRFQADPNYPNWP